MVQLKVITQIYFLSCVYASFFKDLSGTVGGIAKTAGNAAASALEEGTKAATAASTAAIQNNPYMMGARAGLGAYNSVVGNTPAQGAAAGAPAMGGAPPAPGSMPAPTTTPAPGVPPTVAISPAPGLPTQAPSS
ncbi:hypothetical protein NECID01_0407 [Nematocida sp. AWRm77]|nr:hypothetical protein NECID01_0407 [Nematocida sp. AWRm77]